MAFFSSHLTFYLAFYLTFYLAYLLTFGLSYLLTFYLAFYLTFYLACLLTFYLAFYLADLLTFYLAFYLTFYLACLLTFYLAFCVASDILSGISSVILSGILYGFVCGRWGPVEVRRGPRRADPQRSKSRRLRSGEAHGAPNLACWGPARPTALRLSPVEVRRGPLRSRDEVRRGPLRSRAGRWGPARKKEEEGGGRRKKEGRSLTWQVGNDRQTKWSARRFLGWASSHVWHG